MSKKKQKSKQAKKNGVPEQRKAVWVYWKDIVMHGHDEWLEPDEKFSNLAGFQTVGFILAEDEYRIVLVAHYGDDHVRGHETVIPRGTIIEIRELY